MSKLSELTLLFQSVYAIVFLGGKKGLQHR
jgi:hypothetical protein